MRHINLRTIVVSFLLVQSLTALAQKDSVSVAVKVDLKKERIILVSGEDKGAFIIRVPAIQSSSVVIDKYDTLLAPVWSKQVEYSQDYYLRFHKFTNHRLYLVLSNGASTNFEIVDVHPEDGSYSISKIYNFSRPFSVNDLEAYDNRVWISGEMGNDPAAFSLDEDLGKFESLPLESPFPIYAIYDMSFDEERKRLDLFLSTRINKRKCFLVKGVNMDGSLAENLVIQSQERYNLSTIAFSDNEHIGVTHILGTFYRKSETSPDGIYLYELENDSITSYKYILFEELREINQAVPYEDVQVNTSLNNARKTGIREAGPMIIDNFSKIDGGYLFALEVFHKKGEETTDGDDDQNRQEDEPEEKESELSKEESIMVERSERFSNEDALAYRFLDLIVGKEKSEGYEYDRTYLIHLTRALEPYEYKALDFGEGTGELFAAQHGNVTLIDNTAKVVYQYRKGYRKVVLDPNFLKVLDKDEHYEDYNLPYLKKWFDHYYFHYGYFSSGSKDEVMLLIERLDI
ncbi:MAG: hypothetical protein AAFX87_20920 [Bacteroidota bacterium]